jgi:hypothetical protein
VEEKTNQPSKALMIPRQGWRAFRTADELEALVLEYFQWEESRVRCPHMYGLAIFLGVAPRTLYEYTKGHYDTLLNRYSLTLEMAAARVAYEKASGAIDGRYNANFVKFDLTVNHDWIDKKALDVTSNGQTLGAADLEQKPVDPSIPAEQSLRSYQEFCRRVKDMEGAKK